MSTFCMSANSWETKFEKIIAREPFPALVSIIDGNSARGLNLFKGILKNDIDNDNIKEIHLICFGNPPEFYLSALDSKKVTSYDLFRDPCCWIESSSSDCNNLFNKILSSQELQSTIMIDSINTIAFLKDFNYMYNIIHKLKGRFLRIVSLAQGDAINSSDLKKLLFLSNVCVQVHLNISNIIANSSDKTYLAIEGIHKKPSGKVVSIKEVYKIDENYILKSEVYDKRKHESNKSNITTNMKGWTTFRMGFDIKENEKIAKDNLVLPYLRTANQKNGSEGEVIHYAESDDELEEDPDDDLDI